VSTVTQGPGGGEWQRSTYSGGTGEGCIEVARVGGALGLRESDAPPCAALRTSAGRLAALLIAAKAGRFDGLDPNLNPGLDPGADPGVNPS
jgi:hypothetical protein